MAGVTSGAANRPRSLKVASTARIAAHKTITARKTLLPPPSSAPALFAKVTITPRVVRMSHNPANASRSPLASCRYQGRLPDGSSCHSYQPNAGMMQRRRLSGSLKLAALATVSTRALKVLYLIRGSLDQKGSSHHCNWTSSRLAVFGLAHHRDIVCRIALLWCDVVACSKRFRKPGLVVPADVPLALDRGLFRGNVAPTHIKQPRVAVSQNVPAHHILPHVPTVRMGTPSPYPSLGKTHDARPSPRNGCRSDSFACRFLDCTG